MSGACFVCAAFKERSHYHHLKNYKLGIRSGYVLLIFFMLCGFEALLKKKTSMMYELPVSRVHERFYVAYMQEHVCFYLLGKKQSCIYKFTLLQLTVEAFVF